MQYKKKHYNIVNEIAHKSTLCQTHLNYNNTLPL